MTYNSQYIILYLIVYLIKNGNLFYLIFDELFEIERIHHFVEFFPQLETGFSLVSKRKKERKERQGEESGKAVATGVLGNGSGKVV